MIPAPDEGDEIEGASPTVGLQPFTPSRQIAGDAIGLRYFSLQPADALALRENRTYPGMANDAFVAVFLCCLPDERIDRVPLYPASYLGALREWKDAIGATWQSQAHHAIVGIWNDILDDVLDAILVPDEQDEGMKDLMQGPGEGEDQGPGKSRPAPGGPDSFAASHGPPASPPES